ncbi:MAG: chromate transporter [Clostridia bacterium]|nr:chromate transporter [Clostridia bacterium]
MPILLELFLTFAKIGLFTFGGGYAMISLIEDVCVDRRGWITHDEMMDITVIAESTPGPIAINCATFVGYRRGGVLGAVLATFGVVLPSFVIIFLIAQVLDNFLAIPLIAHAFGGIKLAVGLLILDAGLNMMRKMKKKLLPRLILLLSCAAMLAVNLFAWNFSSVTLMLAAGAVGLVCFLAGGEGRRGGGEGR